MCKSEKKTGITHKYLWNILKKIPIIYTFASKSGDIFIIICITTYLAIVFHRTDSVPGGCNGFASLSFMRKIDIKIGQKNKYCMPNMEFL